MAKIPVWIDSDAGVDDAIALMCALKTEKLDVVGMSAVAGNVELVHTFRNIRDVLSLCGREDIKVYRGADRPLVRELVTGTHVHGANGLAGVELEPSKAPVETKPAWDAMYEKAKEMSGQLTLVPVGPLTNVATCISKYPDFKDHIKEIVLMGGALVGGNIRPCAEFNIYVDPHAAQIVFKSGIKITMCGLDVTLKALINESEQKAVNAMNTKQAEIFREGAGVSIRFHEIQGINDYPPHDLCPMWYIAYPELFKTIVTNVYVETQSEITIGKTVTDYWNGDGKLPPNNVTVVMDVDRDEFGKKFVEAFAQYE